MKRNELIAWLVYLGFLIAALLGTASHAQSCITTAQVTLSGSIRGANGIPAKNNSITLTPSQLGFIPACGVNLPTANSCATSTDGSVVGLPNPLTPTINTTSGAGTLPSGTYYTVYEWYDAAGHVTLPSPETVATLSVTGSLVVNPPASGVPSNAVGMDVFISTTTGTETLQGQTTGSASFVQSSALISGAAQASTNTTLCQVIANDAVFPTGTGYIAGMTDPNGNQVPGFPMQWQLMGPGTTINLSNGLPYYHGVVNFPAPILASPANHGTQSISGNLSMGGYNLLNIGSFTATSINTILYATPGTGTISSVLASAIASNPNGSFKVALSCGVYTDNIILNNLNSVLIEGPMRGWGYTCTILKPNIVLNPAVAIEATGTVGVNAGDGLSGLTVTCPASTTCGDGILVSGYSAALFGSNWLTLDDMTITGTPNSATLGFSHNINITGGLLSANFNRLYSVGGFTAGFSMTGSNPQNDIHCKFCLFQNSYGNGANINSTASTAPASVDFDDSVFQFNGYNASNVGVGSACAGLYVNGTTIANVHHSYFEGNCRGNTSGQPIADIRLTGNVNQAFSVQDNSFFQDWNEYGIYNDSVQTSGDYSGNQFTTPSTCIYVATSHALSNVHIGTNFDCPTPTIKADVNGNTHVSMTSPSGDNIGVISSVTSNTIAAGGADHYEIYNGPFTISNITGGVFGARRKYTAATGGQIFNTSGSSGNQISLMGGAAREVLSQGDTITLYYSVDFNRWQEESGSSNITLTNPTVSGYLLSPVQTVQITAADWSCGTGGTVTDCTSAHTISTLSFTLPLAVNTWSFFCEGVVGQATAATANTWSVQTATTGATNVTAWYTMATAATAFAAGATTDNASSTTAFAISPAWTLGATGTKMPFHISGTIEGSALAGTVVNIQLTAPTVGDLVTIYRGAACRVF